MSLDKMNLEELVQLARVVGSLLHAGKAVSAEGIEPRFSMVPGCCPTMTLPYRMPAVSPEWGDKHVHMGPSVEDVLPRGSRRTMFESMLRSGAIDIPAGPSRPSVGLTEHVAAEVTEGPETSKAATEGQAAEAQPEAVTGASGTHSLPGQSDTGKVTPEDAASDRGDAAAVPPSETGEGGKPTEDPEAPTGPRLWTDEEDELVVAMRANGRPYREIAETLGRTEQATQFRANKRLAERIKAASSDPVKPAEDAGITLDQHLAKVPRKRGWDVARDFELLRLAELGWDVPAISMELQISGKEVKDRFEILTDNRRFKRSDVFRALAELAGEEVE